MHSPAPVAAGDTPRQDSPGPPIVFVELFFNSEHRTFVQAVILKCPFCGGRHVHGAGRPGERIARDLGTRCACSKAPATDYRVIVTDPHHVVGELTCCGRQPRRYANPIPLEHVHD